MKRLFSKFSLVALASLLFASAAHLRADDVDLLRGKWLVKKVNESGLNFSQTIEVKKEKFVFQIMDGDNNVVLYAEGSLKLDKLGPFNSVRFYDIRGGSSSADLNEVSDEYNAIYALDGDTWTVASNFDKERDQKPSADAYRRVKETAAEKTLVIDSIEMKDTPQSATWFICFEANVGDSKGRHYKEDKGYDKNQVKIPMELTLAKVKAGQKCSFKMQLDDVDGDVCTEEVDNRSTGEFTVTESGSQTFKPEANWSYTIQWHLK